MANAASAGISCRENTQLIPSKEEGEEVTLEIERKFLVSAPYGFDRSHGEHLIQGYLLTSSELSVRIRRKKGANFLTIKSEEIGLSRQEYEYEIPRSDAEELLRICTGNLIDKVRYTVPHASLFWEVDVFSGRNKGLILAEVEITSKEDAVVLPSWVGAEVTLDPRFRNSYLARHPFDSWLDPPS